MAVDLGAIETVVGVVGYVQAVGAVALAGVAMVQTVQAVRSKQGVLVKARADEDMLFVEEQMVAQAVAETLLGMVVVEKIRFVSIRHLHGTGHGESTLFFW